MYGFIENGRGRTEYYREISIKGTKKGKCDCGKVRTRTMTFSQTVNPFNKNKEGKLKTDNEIYEEIKKEKEEWMNDKHITCNKCYKVTK